MSKIAVALAGLLTLTGCASVEVSDYAAEKPELDLSRYFNGTLDADGMFQDRSGKVVKRFHVVIEASWKGPVGTLDERFTYSDGSTQRRVWTVTKLDANHYSGRADDVVGEASGEARGNALRWKYVMALPVDGKVYNVDFDDWMFLMDDRVMLNRSVMSKFGFRLGEVSLSFRKRE
ncbi:MAG: DUF3833 domain-containing protein [Zoogloea oleivorans]|jgi:hypothetical protein|uniref:DUF3833 domain-containing protein n=1 Tax=Zoogloea oleivorans TaxID=1552750 RepID=UPI0027F5D1AE|nr:DUF3833 domain-containing protein [Zoogloea oleivorans]MBT9496112.1 DUF3833 domain-containing protein [Zoogloea sp.]MDY0035971.1 DUF3833 domain-containing protein [Zoogloea oleivorans]